MARRGGSHTRSTRSTPHDGEGKGPAGHLSHARRRTLKKTQLSDSVLASPSLRDELFSSVSWAACCSIIAWPREMVSSHSDQGSQRKCQKAVLGGPHKHWDCLWYALAQAEAVPKAKSSGSLALLGHSHPVLPAL